jgi:hypothetical protein
VPSPRPQVVAGLRCSTPRTEAERSVESAVKKYRTTALKSAARLGD